MLNGTTIFAQIMADFPHRTFAAIVKKYHGDTHVKKFSCLDRFKVMAFAPLTGRESLRDTIICLNAMSERFTNWQASSKYLRNGVVREISTWKSRLIDNVAEIFQDNRVRKKEEPVQESELFEQIGRLKMELDWVKKKICPARLSKRKNCLNRRIKL